MIFMMFLISLSVVLANAPLHWEYLNQIVERHEFYENNELIEKPKDSWQTLFGGVYTTIDLRKNKDCVFFRVPGIDPGELKIKTVSISESCDKYILAAPDKELKDIRSLHFMTSTEKISLDITFLPEFRSERWEGRIQEKFKSSKPVMHMSSAEFRNSKLTFLSPVKSANVAIGENKLSENSLCHNISDDCEELQPSSCFQCESGWYEIPNGCEKGPKYCGRHDCGGKGKPACRRGMKWQRSKTEKFDCRINSSFAYCLNDLKVFCEGALAFCR